MRDGIRDAKIGYGYAECEITDGGKPPPRCGDWFVSVHGGDVRSERDNQLYESYSFSLTLTARLGRVSIDRVGDMLIARNVPRGQANREGFNARVEALRGLLHMNWRVVVLPHQSPNSANDNLVAWATAPSVYGFCEPMRYRGVGRITETPPGWFDEDPDVDTFGIRAELRFEDARRFQPQTLPAGAFI